MSRRFYLIKDFWEFLKENKKWWLIPLIVLIVLTSILIIVGSSSPVPVFIYPLA